MAQAGSLTHIAFYLYTNTILCCCDPPHALQMVCQGASARDERIRIASFTCLHEIAANYYAKLPAYMGEVFAISVKAINEDSEDVGLQAVEFWSTLCDIELDLADEDDPAEVRLLPHQQYKHADDAV